MGNSFLGREGVLPRYVNGNFHLQEVGAIITCIRKEEVKLIESEGIRQILSFVRIRPCFVAITTLGRQVLTVRLWRRVVIILKIQCVRIVCKVVYSVSVSFGSRVAKVGQLYNVTCFGFWLQLSRVVGLWFMLPQYVNRKDDAGPCQGPWIVRQIGFHLVFCHRV